MSLAQHLALDLGTRCEVRFRGASWTCAEALVLLAVTNAQSWVEDSVQHPSRILGTHRDPYAHDVS